MKIKSIKLFTRSIADLNSFFVQVLDAHCISSEGDEVLLELEGLIFELEQCDEELIGQERALISLQLDEASSIDFIHKVKFFYFSQLGETREDKLADRIKKSENIIDILDPDGRAWRFFLKDHLLPVKNANNNFISLEL